MATTTSTIAWSVDGTTFACRGPISTGLPLGGYVRVTADGVDRVGQMLHQEVIVQDGRRMVAGGGTLLGAGSRTAFDDAEVVAATDAEVRAALPLADNPLIVGTLRDHADIPAALTATGFNRHTFLCGQSGSGKTYSLGVLLERLVLQTSLPLLIMDPNGDHVHLGGTADGVEAAMSAAYAKAAEGIQVHKAHPGPDEHALRIHLEELGHEGMAGALAMDPIRDRAEYNSLVHLAERADEHGIKTVQDAVEAMAAEPGDVGPELAMRVENLGLDRMEIWAGTEGRSVMAEWLDTRPRAVVADTSGFSTRTERLAVAVSILTQLWQHRRDRNPLLLVVDEAHDVCPAEPSDALEQVAVELFTRIAGEGRKYGIHLLLSTQRPDKIPDNVLSQCDNLLLMRVNSSIDRTNLAERFGFAPPELVDMVGEFGLGEALLAGRVARPPVLARIGSRITPEGGGDIATDWAHRPA